MLDWFGFPLASASPSSFFRAAARAEIARDGRVVAGTPASVARVGRRRGLVVYYHGGGWVVGDLDTHDPLCRFLAREADVAVLAIDYRLALEHGNGTGRSAALSPGGESPCPAD